MSNFLETILSRGKQSQGNPGMNFPLEGVGDIPQQAYYPEQYMDPIGSPALPPVGSYGAAQPSFNEKIAEMAIGTSIKIDGVPIRNIDDLPTLFYFLTDNWRHFQLSNLKKADQRDIERSIADIHMLSGQMGNEYLCKLKQFELFNSIYLYKSRSDLESEREREQWTRQTTRMEQQEIHRPKEGSGGFLSFFTGKNKGGDY
jgi:hypothetical protein